MGNPLISFHLSCKKCTPRSRVAFATDPADKSGWGGWSLLLYVLPSYTRGQTLVTGLVIYNEDCYCMWNYSWLHGLSRFRTHNSRPFTHRHASRPTCFPLNNWLFKSQVKGLCQYVTILLKGYSSRKPGSWKPNESCELRTIQPHMFFLFCVCSDLDSHTNNETISSFLPFPLRSEG